MSADFECFVTIGDKKHSIYLDKDIDNVIFRDIYQQLTQLDVNPVISFDNYVFEVFDFEDNCFQRLTSVETPIKYLSRIRVLPKNSNNGNNYQTNRDYKQKDFNTNFNNDLFNPEIIDENQVNEDFFNVEAPDTRPALLPLPKPKRPIGPTRYWHNFERPLYAERSPEEEEEYEMNEEFYNEMYFNTNKRKKVNTFGAVDFEYDYSGPPAPTHRPYMRRSDIIEPIPGPSFVDPYMEAPPQPYYRPRDDYYRRQDTYGPPPQYSGYYRPDLPYNPPNYSQNMSFRPDFNQRMGFRPDFSPGFRPNFSRNTTTGYRNPKRKEQHNDSEPQYFKNPRIMDSLRINGFTLEEINGFEYYFCEFCEIKFKSVNNAQKHIHSDTHQTNSNEKNINPLDKLLLVKSLRQPSHGVAVLRRRELRKISKTDKQKLVRHGIRLKDATGPQAYVCIRCCSSLSSLTDALKHYDKFSEINKTINYPKDYHSLNEDYSLPKIELRYRRILNSLEILVEENRSEEKLQQLIQLRDEGVVFKESLDVNNKADVQYYSCLVCDKRFAEIEEGLEHIKSEDHKKNRSHNKYKGLDRAMLLESERSNQIEVVLARKQELEKIKCFTKELNFDHGIRLKDGIGPEAYRCVKCEVWFDSSNTVKLHVDEYDKQVINESTEEFLIDSAKRQMELLSEEANTVEEEEPKPDQNEDIKEEPNSSPGVEEGKEVVIEEQISNQKIKEEEVVVVVEDEEEKGGAEGDEDDEEDEEVIQNNGLWKRGGILKLNTDEDIEQMDVTTEEDKIICEKFSKEGIKTFDTEDENGNKFYDIFCDIYFKDKEQTEQHLSRSFHNRMKFGEFLSDIDKAFCVSTHRMDEPEVALSRINVLQKMSDEVKQKFSEEGIRLKDGIGREAFWCLLCNDPILSPNVESSSYSFINHINYNSKHVELLIGQNK